MPSNITQAFVALGGNIGDALNTLINAAKVLSTHCDIKEVALSKFYLTSPVSDIPQKPYINAVCSVKTILELRPFFNLLISIENQFGKKIADKKNSPRIIDLDLLFFGEQFCCEEDLTVPHPRWKDRLFVLKPLRDLTDKVIVPRGINKNEFEIIDLDIYMQSFTNPYNETICVLN